MRDRSLIAPLLAGTVAFLFRFITHDTFANDHYVNLSLAQAMLAGDRPILDYTEVGAPFMAAVSAAAQAIFGQGLLPELMLTVSALSVAAAVTCWATARLTGSQTLGFLAALVQIATFPRLYGYPKILIYPILFVIGWAYLQHPDRKRLAALAAWTAWAFLLRHDHGAYCAIGCSAAVVQAHWPQGAVYVLRRGATYAAFTLLFASPYLIYVEAEVGLPAYFRTGVQVSRTEAGRGDWVLPPLSTIRWGPLVRLEPRRPQNLSPIAVRWRTELSDDARHAYERSLGLLYPELRDDRRSWSYRVEPPATDTLSRLVQLPDAADTAGFDRASLQLQERPHGLRRIAIASNLDRVAAGTPLQDFFSTGNSSTVIFYTLWLLPVVSVGVWALGCRESKGRLSCGREVLLLAAIAMPTIAGLVRSPTATRIPDAFGTAPILAVWTLAAIYGASPRSLVTRGALKVFAVAAGVTLAIAVASMASLDEKLDHADLLEEPTRIAYRARDILTRTRTWPWRGEWPAGAGSELVPYLNRCTTPQDRLLVLWNAPQFNVFSRRAFAGGETLLIPRFRDPATYEPAVLARLRQQHVPIVLANQEERQEFETAYPHIAAYLAARYQQALVLARDGEEIQVLVDRERKVLGTDSEFNLPCFAPRADVLTQHRF